MAILHAKKSIKQPIKILFDPEEEIGSPSLDSQIHEILNSLECKNLIIVDGLIPAENQAAITVGCRGIVTFDVSLDYHPSDLHSGLFGGLASNPALDLAKALSQAHDKNGSIAIPSFYDSIDKSAIDFQKKFNSPLLQTELSSVVKLNNNISNLWASPTFEVNGIQSGFCGEGFKTIIPSKASAKISCRLVPGQDPKEIGQIVKSFILSKVPYPDLCTIKINKGSGSAFFTDPQTPFIQTLKNTFSTVLDSQCQINCIGGSIPIVAKLQKCLKAPTAIIGLGLSSDLIHAPNEHFSYNRMKQGYAFIYSLLHTL